MQQDRQNIIRSAELEEITHSWYSSFKIGVYQQSYFERMWHYHPEFELLLVTKGFGRRYVGDHSEMFSEGDLVLLGAQIPHAWISDPHFLEPDNEDICESIYVQFRKKIFGTQFIDVPELGGVRSVLQKAERGIKIVGEGKEEIIDLVKELPDLSPLEQLLNLFRILDLINRTEHVSLVSDEYLASQIKYKSRRMRKLHKYIMENFKDEISVADCARLTEMTTSSFCRFFKLQSNTTFTNYLNNIRMDFAQKLLLNTDLSIKSVGYECGFKSIPYFNQQFKRYAGKSPSEFRKGFI